MKGILKKAPNTRSSWKINFLDEEKSVQIGEQRLPPELFSLAAEEREGQIVEFDYEGGLAKNIKATGEKWQEAASEQQDFTVLLDREESVVQPANGYKSFHNPYNFIPAPPRKREDENLGDHEPVGQDRYYPDHWSGRIAVKLLVKTPLLIPDAARAKPLNPNAQPGSDAREHKVYPTRTIKGDPYLPPTSIKGMLRSAYEAITNSRMGIFHKHGGRVAYRMPAGDATSEGLFAARVERRGDILGLRLMVHRKLPRYSDASDLKRGEGAAALKYTPEQTLPQHGDKVWVNAGIGKIWEVRKRLNDTPPEGNWQKGWVCVTGPNISTKRNERVFIEKANDQFIEINEAHEKMWRELIADYQAIHQRELTRRAEKEKEDRRNPDAYLDHSPGKTAWSRHIYKLEAKELSEETLCYVELDSPEGGNVKAIFPVLISRRLHNLPPEKLLDDSLKPATAIDELSPADRVFGWINQKGNGAVRGNLRIGSVKCDSPQWQCDFDKSNPLPLAILSTPKPQQARFYVAKSEQGEKQDDGIKKEEAGYIEGKGLRGRKVYPHHSHATLSSGYWDKPQQNAEKQQSFNGHFLEYRRTNSVNGKPVANADFNGWQLTGQAKRDDQNRSILSWVKPKTQFSFTIDVANLSSVELGALLWLLELPDHQTTGRQRFHRLGGGKPLGFGSVKLVIDWQQTDLRKGQDWSGYYQSLNELPNPEREAAKACPEQFADAVIGAYGKEGEAFDAVSFIAAFLQAAEGFNDGLPIHYPRVRPDWLKDELPAPPHPEGKSFEWFVTNESTSGDGLALPDLKAEAGLKFYDE